jgi:ankyrin repeat protein
MRNDHEHTTAILLEALPVPWYHQEHLRHAAIGGSAKALAVLVARRPYAMDFVRSNPLKDAADYGQVGVLQVLVACKADLNGPSCTMPALWHASNMGHVPAVQWLLDQKAAVHSVNRAASPMCMPLSVAAQGARNAVVSLLLKHGAGEVGHDAACAQALFSTLYTTGEHATTIKLLLDSRVGVNCTDAAGKTPLLIACATGDVNTARVLLHSKAEVNNVLRNGDTPLAAACKSRSTKIVRMLLDHKACVHASPQPGQQTPLTAAASRNHAAMAALLVRRAAQRAVP